MSDETIIRKTSIYLNLDLLKRLKGMAIEQQTSVNALMLRVIEREYAEHPSAAHPERVPDAASHRHQDLIDKLLYVLDSDSKDAIKAVASNINVFYRLVRVDDRKSGRLTDHSNGENNDKLTG